MNLGYILSPQWGDRGLKVGPLRQPLRTLVSDGSPWAGEGVLEEVLWKDLVGPEDLTTEEGGVGMTVIVNSPNQDQD